MMIKNRLHDITVSKSEYISPNLPSMAISQKKINNLMELLGQEDSDYIVGIIDSTVTGSLKTGIVFFEDCLYYSNKNEYQKIYYHEIQRVDFTSYTQKANREEAFWVSRDKSVITLRTGKKHLLEECLRGVKYKKIEALLKQIVDSSIQTPAIRTRQNSLFHELPEGVKLQYMYVLYNYYHLSPVEVQDEIASHIQNFFARIELSAEKRLQARLYMGETDTRKKTGYLVKLMERNLSGSDYELVRFSLMQDILYLDAINPKKSETNQGFVNSLKEFLSISGNQINLMQEAIKLHLGMMDPTDAHIDSVVFADKMKRLREGAVALYMPASALFSAGSVYAPSTFHKLKRFWEEKKTINLQRELMLKNVIENNQMTINFLIEDLNQLSIKLMQEIQKSNTTYLKINKLANELQKIQQKNFKLEKAVLIDKLTDEKYQSFIQKGVFDKYIVRNENGIEFYAGINYEELRQLKFMLERLEEKYE